MKQLSLIPLWCDHEWKKWQTNSKFIKIPDMDYYRLHLITKYKCVNCWVIKEVEGE